MQRLTFFLFLLVGVFLNAAPMIYENQKIQEIDVVVNLPSGVDYDIEQVRSKIKTRAGNIFSQAEFDNDLKNLSSQYDRVEPQIKTADDGLIITLKLWPKPTIRTINFEGNCKKSTKILNKELGIGICSIFDRKTFNTAFHKLKAFYVKKGFFEAELDYKVTLDPCTNEVDILIIINEGRSGRVKEIRLCGFDECEEDEILGKIATKEYTWWKSWLTDEGTYRQEAIDHDEFQILQYLQNEGYADAKVDIEIKEAGNDRIIVVVTCDKGELYTINKIRFKGNVRFTDEQIYEQFEIEPGSPYSPELIRETVSNVQALYGKYGFIDCYVNFEPKIECDKVYSVDFEIDEGEQFRVGLIKIFGNCHTQNNIILHETILVPGEIFNTEKLKLSETRLMNIGYFKKVNVYAVKRDEESALPGCYRDVHIEVEEQSTGKFGLFFGFSTSDALFGGASLSENNFNILGIPYVWKRGFKALRGGGEYLNMSAQFGTKSREYLLSWTKPYFMDTKWSVGFDLENSYNHYISHAFSIHSSGVTFRATRELNIFTKLQLHYRIRDSHVQVEHAIHEADKENANKNLSKSHNKDKKAALADPQILELSKRQGCVCAMGSSLIYENMDSVTRPTKGFRSSLEVELAGLGGNYQFWGFGYINTYYYPLTKKSGLKYRADLRFITPFAKTSFETMPLDERLYMGGNNMVRGFRPYHLGPKYPGTDIPKGGLSMQLYSVEYNYAFTPRFETFTFCDVGHLSTKYWDLSRQKIRASLGIGMRVNILDSLPPITIGYGFPLFHERRAEVKKFFIQFGAKF